MLKRLARIDWYAVGAVTAGLLGTSSALVGWIGNDRPLSTSGLAFIALSYALDAHSKLRRGPAITVTVKVDGKPVAENIQKSLG